MVKWFLLALVVISFTTCENLALPEPAGTMLSDAERSLTKADSNFQYLTYRGIRPDDPNGTIAIDNPERGFRFEFIMKANNLKNPYHDIDYSSQFENILINEEIRYGKNKIRLAQVYFYLTDYLNSSIPVSAINNMQYIFDKLEKQGIKVLLRFAYRYNENIPYESVSDIWRHLSELQSFMAKNESSIFLVQAGFLGIWGEWHHSGYDDNLGAQGIVIRHLLNNIPPSKKLQVRETRFKKDAVFARSGKLNYIDPNVSSNYDYHKLVAEETNRIGFHNDYFVLDQGSNAHWDYKWPDSDFFQAREEAPYTTMDGEMPYARGKESFNIVAYGKEGGWYAARRMRTHAYSSFSIVHNYTLNISAWKTHWLHPNKFRADGTLVTDDYFLDKNGNEVERRAFEYIRDHLGYRLQLRNSMLPVKTKKDTRTTFKATIKNFGFSRTINNRDIYFVLIDTNNNVLEKIGDLKTGDIFPTMGQYDGEYTITADWFIEPACRPGIYKVGIWIPDYSARLKYNPDYAIKLANGNIAWWKDNNNKYLVNIIGSTEIY